MRQNASTAVTGEAQAAIAHAREVIAASLDARPSQIYFTSGGSEADNWAVKGVAEAWQTTVVISLPAGLNITVLNSCHYLEEQGYEVTYLDVDQAGPVSLEQFRGKAVREDTILISVMFGNNEVGTIEPVMQIGRFARDHQILFHTDAVQASFRIPISRQYHIDLLSAGTQISRTERRGICDMCRTEVRFDAVLYPRRQPGAWKTCGNGECTRDRRDGEGGGTGILQYAQKNPQGDDAAQLSD